MSSLGRYINLSSNILSLNIPGETCLIYINTGIPAPLLFHMCQRKYINYAWNHVCRDRTIKRWINFPQNLYTYTYHILIGLKEFNRHCTFWNLCFRWFNKSAEQLNLSNQQFMEIYIIYQYKLFFIKLFLGEIVFLIRTIPP